MKKNRIQPERKPEISPNEFFRDDFPIEQSRDIKNTPFEKRIEKKNQEDFREFYY